MNFRDFLVGAILCGLFFFGALTWKNAYYHPLTNLPPALLRPAKGPAPLAAPAANSAPMRPVSAAAPLARTSGAQATPDACHELSNYTCVRESLTSAPSAVASSCPDLAGTQGCAILRQISLSPQDQAREGADASANFNCIFNGGATSEAESPQLASAINASIQKCLQSAHAKPN